MKVKKLAALALACAVVAASGAVMAACNGNGGNDDDKKGGFVEDTRIWYAVGTSEKGPLKENNWDFLKVAEKLTLTRDTTKTDENVFTLNLDIYAGDKFKFVYQLPGESSTITADVLYGREVGIYNVDTVTGEGEEAVIKDGEDTLFKTAGGLDTRNLICQRGQDGKYVITLKTFPEQGADEQVVISITKDEKIKIPYDMYVYGDMNDFGWKNIADYAMESKDGVWTYKLDVTADDLTRDATGAKVTGETKGTYAAVQLFNDGEGEKENDPKKFAVAPAEGDTFLKVTDKANGEINLLPEGKWTITFTESGKVLSIVESAYEMYFRGTGTDMTWNTCPEAVKLSESKDGTYHYGYIEVTPEQATAGGVEFKVYNNKTGDWFGPDVGNYKLEEAGKYFVKFTLETETVEYEKCEYYVVGTFEGTDFNIKKDVTPMLVAGAEANVVTCTLNVKSALANFGWVAEQGPEGSLFAIQVVYGCELAGKDAQDWVGGGNTFITAEGDYTISFTTDTHKTTVTPKA